MHDQAQPLRRLVRDCLRTDDGLPTARGDLLLVAGGKGGVGTTSVALGLALAFQQLGRRTLLVDAHPTGGDGGLMCSLEAGGPPGETLEEDGQLADWLQRGPDGIQILAGPPPLARQLPGPAMAFDPRWMTELAQLALPPELVVVDAGSGVNPLVGRLWKAADAALIVTTPDTPSVINTYAFLKQLRSPLQPIVYCLVNRAADSAAAGVVFARIHRACRRFLALEPRPVGFLPDDPALAAAHSRGEPLLPGRSAAAQRLVRAASAVSEGLQAAGEQRLSRISEQEQFNFEPSDDRYSRTLSVAEQPLNYAD